MQKEAEVILKVNSKQAEEKFRTLEEKAKSLRSKLADAFRSGDTRGIDDINKELKKVNREIDRMRTNAANIKAAMVRLDQASPKELQRVIRLINEELSSGRVKRGSAEWDDYVAKLKEAKTELQKVKQEMEPDKEETFLDKIKDSLGGLGGKLGGAAAVTAVVAGAREAIQAYADMEAEEANVRKFTGMTAEEVASLNEKFREIDTRTPREELNRLAQEAGRLGKTSQEDVLGFVRAADQINVALDDLGEDATLTLSKLTGIFGDEAKYGTEQSLLKVGSVINDLSQNCSASAPYLAEFSSRLGGIAAQSKMSISQVMAFGAVLDTNNLNVEASATAVGQLITAIYKEPAKIAKAAGMDVTKFSQMVKTDMNGALIALFEQLNKFGGMQNLATVFDSMGTDGARAIPVFTALAGHIGDLKAQQEAASEAFREGTSVSKEAAIQNNTVQAQLDKAKNNIHELVVSLGEKLWPVMNLCISGTSMLMRVLSVLVSFIANNKGVIVTLIATIVTYTTVAKASALVTKAWTVATTACNGVASAFKASILALRIAYMELTGQTLKAEAAQRMFAMTTKANPLGLLMAGATAVIGTLITMIQKINDNRRAAEEAAREYEEWKRSISNVDDASAEYAAKELTRLDLLYNAAIDESKSKDERKKAVEQLQNLYPGYFKNLNSEQISVDSLTQTYQRLRDSILEAARARAAADLIYENQKQIIKLEGERDAASNDRKNASKKRDQIRARNRDKDRRANNAATSVSGAMAMSGGGSSELYAHESTAAADQAVASATSRLIKSQRKINELNKANQRLANEYRKSQAFQNQMGVNSGSGSSAGASGGSKPTRGETDKERQEREKAARQARQAEKEAQREAKEALKKDLDDRKSLYLQAEAENLMLYVTGRQTYADYLAQKENLDREYADDVIKIHENHNKLDIAAYGQALKTKADMLRKQQESRRRYSLSYLEKEHEGNTDSITSDYYDPSAREFQNKTILTQRLLQEDLRYITEKKKLYSEGSEEWAALEREYNDRIRQDQLDKMKETAEAVKWYKENFTKESATLQRETELAMLEQLHARELISEKDYQEAVKKLKEKYRDEDLENAQGIKSEFVDILKDMFEAFAGLLEGFNRDDLTKLVENACALMSAAVSQYTAYANAERDLELAKIEKRYDKEIAAAGKNSKKKKKLEEQKEAEVAKVKKKYNDRAMKVEIAQAIAQTALAAIAAYASGSKVNVWLGPVAAALALAAGAVQIATIKKQHEAEAAGYYEGGFTRRDPDNRREAGVVHANEFVANHQAVANPALSPVLRLIDTAQRNNTVGSLTAADVSNALGQGAGVSARGAAAMGGTLDSVVAGGLALAGEGAIRSAEAIDRLNDTIADGIEAKVILDGEDGFHKKYQHFQKLQNNPKR